MASPKLPKRFHRGLVQLLSLPEESFQRVVTAFEGSPISIELREEIGEIVSSIDTIQPNDVNGIADALMSLYMVRANSEDETPVLVIEVAQTLEKVNLEGLNISPGYQDNIQPRLTRLLELNSFVVGAKAVSVMLEHDIVFYRARVLTDIRPVFGATIGAPQAAVITHSLRIHYHQGEDHKDFFVMLDTQDVQTLIDVLERAKVKAENLKGVLATANIPYIEPEE